MKEGKDILTCTCPHCHAVLKIAKAQKAGRYKYECRSCGKAFAVSFPLPESPSEAGSDNGAVPTKPVQADADRKCLAIGGLVEKKKGFFRKPALYSLKAGLQTIGRKDSLIPSDIMLDDSTVSRRSVSVNVIKASDNDVPEEVCLCATTESVGKGILKGCPNLMEVYWNTALALEQDVFGDDEPVLLYVPEGTSVYRTDNVVIGTTAENLVLDARRGLRSHTPFTARKASYTRTFGKETHVGTAAGWETLALPFDVQRITGTNLQGQQLELYPFQEGKGVEGDSGFGTRYGLFWLAGLQADGWQAHTEMKANVPYIIAMPNGNDYEKEFCIGGDVTFSAENVEVRAVPRPTAGMGFAMRPVYERVAQADTVYALNNATWRETYLPGSVFVRGGRGVEPFECYLKGTTAEAQAKRYVAIGMNDGIDAVRRMLKDHGDGWRVWTDENGLNVMADRDCHTGIYGVDGRLLVPLRLKAGQKVTKRLVPGVYIVGKQKITVH